MFLLAQVFYQPVAIHSMLSRNGCVDWHSNIRLVLRLEKDSVQLKYLINRAADNLEVFALFINSNLKRCFVYDHTYVKQDAVFDVAPLMLFLFL